MENRFFTATQKRDILATFNHACAVCGNSDIDALEADHFVAYDNGGATHINNGMCLCGICNRIKGNIQIPEYYKMTPRDPAPLDANVNAAMQRDRKRFSKWLQMFKGTRVPPNRPKAKWKA